MQFTISDEEFSAFRHLLYKLIGIQLNEQKKMLVISRLSKRLRQLHLENFSQYLDYLHTSADKESELVTLINQMTTNSCTAIFINIDACVLMRLDFGVL